MKNRFLYGLLCLGILVISKVSYAQELDSIMAFSQNKSSKKEDNSLKFQTYFFEALKQNAINNHSKAIESLEQCMAIDNNNTAVHFEFSKNYFGLKKYNEAQIFIDNALKNEPENVYLLNYKVLIFKRQRNFTDAIVVQKKLIKINPKYSEDLILLYLQNQEYENAEKMIVEVEKKALGSTKIIGYKKYLDRKLIGADTLNVAQNETENNVDLATLKKQFNLKKDYKVLVNILNYEAENNLFEMLVTDSANGLEFYPSQPFLYKMNGLALNKLAKYNEAIAVLTIGIDFVIDNNVLEADFYEQLAISYQGLNNKNEALKYQQKAAELRR
ncbi:hypothetical protein EC396_00315 [Lutibacter sp. HS1-25]|uniref:tetratricopeptide repeat protein n=1 Tax=Lutibacter sp. HS1-25 TaxID=2485000 RepID=UPI001012ED5F|nr:hypothetical protein [Lutibacter sp. HS1-25]RXP64454.1 hypothetical protein EC396_00315 [Lutibacter sp. HS1-25]